MKECSALVSIIVPVYGTEAYLPTCIESLCNQTYQNIQIILVDDQSTDRCPEICDEYAKKDSRITVIHQKNKGVSGARNTGLCHASGEYIMFVDSDDELYPEAVALLLQNADEYCADVVSATKKVVDEKGTVIKACEDGARSVFRGEESLLLSLSGDGNTNSACAKLFKADFIKGISFVEGMNINEDGFFLFLCYMRKPILVQLNIAVYRYHVRAGSASRDRFSDKYLSMLYFCEKKKETILAYCPQYEKEVLNMEARVYLQMLDLLCSTVDKKYKALQKECIMKVRELRGYHKPINQHYGQLERIVVHGLYPLYKKAVRFKYYR